MKGRRRFADLGHAAEVDLADEIAEGVEGMVEFLDRVFGGLAGFGVVAVEAGFGNEVRSGAGKDLQGAIFETGADGGDGWPEVLVALADGEAGVTEFENLAGAVRVGVPGDAAKRWLVIGHWSFVVSREAGFEVKGGRS